MIGREKEKEKLMRAYGSDHSQFVAIYGRRRVGKTFLVRETFNYQFTFTYTGARKVTTKTQLSLFANALKKQGLDKCPKPHTWFEAFDLLTQLLEASPDSRKIVFLDELPWMDAPRSHFVAALENFWNGWATARRDILLVVCGSASSWIINKIFKNHGGLYNRVDFKIHLAPFSLHECELLAKEMKLPWVRSQITEGYMIMGGVPYYWSKLEPNLSVAQNIDALFCNENGEFRYEYAELYASIFENPDKHIAIIEALASSRQGLSREKIIELTRLPDNGKTSEALEDLEHCGFIRKYCHLNKQSKDALYQLVDNFTLFYHQFLKSQRNLDDDYWLKTLNTPKYNAWKGLAFERVCLLHARQIKKALGISGMATNIHSWHVKGAADRPGAQIDLIIDRPDGIVNVCEMKYSTDNYRITNEDRASLSNKMSRLSETLPPSKSAVPVLVTPFGLEPNQNSDIINWVITLNDLFEA